MTSTSMIAKAVVGICLATPLGYAGANTSTALNSALTQFRLTCVLNADSSERCRPHGQAPVRLPAIIVPLKAYVFNKRLPGGVSAMATEELPKRLRESGCKVESAPRSSRDFLFADEGEPIFVIRARCDGLLVEIRNRFNPLISNDIALRKQWSVSDLVVKIR